MNPHHQPFPGNSPAGRGDGRPSYRNFLIVVPDQCQASDVMPLLDARVNALARHLNEDGFAYVAHGGRKEMEDDSFGVRHMPLGQDLPSFGSMSVVVVLQDRTWALRAAATYPDADVFLLECPRERHLLMPPSVPRPQAIQRGAPAFGKTSHP